MSASWQLLPNEHINNLLGAIPYVAPCPACGHDAKWRDVLVTASSPSWGSRTFVQPDIDCSNCGPLDVAVEMEA